ncbi:curli biogenesis system outer membrane secretion channel CsgG [Dyella japonica]|uniref:Curli biogenesis system outer membrane secretion channel CsgG n=2 Tax=Dyella japonica TaxID=231455 RepID=A0ABV2JW98_9GAMM
MNQRRKAAIKGGAWSIAAMMAASCSIHAESVQDQRAAQMTQIPTCATRLGTLAVEEPERGVDWWSERQLPSPTKLIKVFVAKSGCFTLVDRGVGMAMAQQERDLAANGDLRVRSNLGKGQIKAADYVLVPDLVTANQDAGGTSLGGALGGLLGHSKVGRIAGNLNISSKTADVVLTLTDVRSSEQVATVDGSAKKNDIGFGGSGALWGASGVGGAGVGGYANTEVGQVITMAYLQAYNKMVAQLGSLPSNASQSNAQQAVTMLKPGRLLGSATGGAVVRTLDPGMMLYPTGNKQGAMWEVEDELGNKGWVSSTLLQLSR